MNNKIYTSNFTYTIEDIAPRTEPHHVLVCTPDYFDIIDVKNAFMEGQAGLLNKAEAKKEWTALKQIYSQLSLLNVVQEVMEIPGVEGLEDMVFCANQTFPWVNENGEKVVVLSQMKHESRKKEVPYFKTYFEGMGYTALPLKRTELFEGMGDTIAHPHKWLLYGGYGHRSNANAHEELAEILGVPIILLELLHPKFYHLDTCFLPIDTDHVMLCKEAFTPQGIASIQHFFKHLHFISEEEAERTFCLNAHIPYHPTLKHAIIQKNSLVAISILQELGFTVHETETAEFMKSGGSVFCMKMMVY